MPLGWMGKEEAREELIDMEKSDSVECPMGSKNRYGDAKGASFKLKSSGRRVRFCVLFILESSSTDCSAWHLVGVQ